MGGVRVASRDRPQAPRKQRPGRFIRAIGILGRILVGAGLVLLFYTTYLLWGTGVYTKQAQGELTQTLEQAPTVTQEEIAATGDIPAARPDNAGTLGEALFTMEIPDIGLHQAVVEGVGREELKKGPGHFPSCGDVPDGTDCVNGSPYPGEDGNVAISGHRTTYGAPFFKLNELEEGDVIDITWRGARYRYRVREQVIVAPTQRDVIADHDRNELTLTTCHPRFSAAQRLIVHADYEGATLIATPSVAAPPDVAAPPGGEEERELQPGAPPVVPQDVLILGSIAIVAFLLAMGLSDRLRKWSVYLTLTLGASAVLWVAVFPQVLRLMPANY